MINRKSTILFLFLFVSVLNAQFDKLRPNEGYVGGGLGVTWIDNEPYYSFHLFPELAFANIGVGLDLNLEFNKEGKLRHENFNEFSDYLSIIRYVRYGQKHDPFYARLGALDYATLGHGSIMYLYNNRPSFDARKIGLELDVDFNVFGFEGVYGSFGEAGVAGLRGYFRPLLLTSLADVPVIGGIEFGASYVGDFNKYSGVLSGSKNSSTGNFEIGEDEGNTNIIGLDVALPILRTGILDFDLYYDYAKILEFGSGTALGGIISANGLGIVDLRARLERRFNGDHYIPSYFNALYEIERFKYNSSSNIVKSKVQILKSDEKLGDGYYGELLVRVLGTFDILGSYQRLDDYPESGILHLETQIMPEGFPYVARAGYDKANIKNESDLFKLDDRSYLFAELGYKPWPYVIVSMVYNWTFTPVRDADDNIIDYAPQKKIEPRISFVFPFNF